MFVWFEKEQADELRRRAKSSSPVHADGSGTAGSAVAVSGRGVEILVPAMFREREIRERDYLIQADMT
jgi:hypothetical protein